MGVFVGVFVGHPGVFVAIGVFVGPPGVFVAVGVFVGPPGVLVGTEGVFVAVGVFVTTGVTVGVAVGSIFPAVTFTVTVPSVTVIFTAPIGLPGDELRSPSERQISIL